MGFRFSPRIVTDGLIYYVDAANRNSYVSGSTMAYSLASDKYDGTLYSGVTYSDNSFEFDGVDGYIGIGEVIELKSVQKCSYQFWVKKKSSFTSGVWILGRTIPLYDTVASYFDSSGRVASILYYGSMRTNNSIPLNTWVNIAMVYDGSLSGNSNRVKIYIDGVLQATTSIGSIIPATTGPGTSNFAIGGLGTATTPSSYFNGNINNVKIYNRALTAEEINQNYNTLKGRFGL